MNLFRFTRIFHNIPKFIITYLNYPNYNIIYHYLPSFPLISRKRLSWIKFPYFSWNGRNLFDLTWFYWILSEFFSKKIPTFTLIIYPLPSSISEIWPQILKARQKFIIIDTKISAIWQFEKFKIPLKMNLLLPKRNLISGINFEVEVPHKYFSYEKWLKFHEQEQNSIMDAINLLMKKFLLIFLFNAVQKFSNSVY